MLNHFLQFCVYCSQVELERCERVKYVLTMVPVVHNEGRFDLHLMREADIVDRAVA